MMNRYEFAVMIILRVSAVIVLLSIPTIFLPEEWMAAIHQWLGLGELPRVPIVWYMARSLSAMYAILGMFTWMISLDVKRYGPLITLWCCLHLIFGAVVILIDYWADLPTYWTLGEGPPLMVFGAIVLGLQRAGARRAHPPLNLNEPECFVKA